MSEPVLVDTKRAHFNAAKSTEGKENEAHTTLHRARQSDFERRINEDTKIPLDDDKATGEFSQEFGSFHPVAI